MTGAQLMTGEEQLVRESQAGSERAFAELVLRHQGRVRAYIGRYVRNQDVADDLAQEAFLSAFRTLDGYKGEAPLGIWLMAIARHRALTFLRGESRRRRRETSSLSGAVASWRLGAVEADAGELEGRDREISALQNCVKRLPGESAKLVREHYFDGVGLSNIAELLGKKQSSLRMTLLRIRKALRKCIEETLRPEVARP